MQLERMLPVVLEHLVKAVDGEGGVVYLCDEDNDLLELAAVYGDERYRKRFTLSESLPGEVYAALDAVRERYPGFELLPLHDRKSTLLGVLAIKRAEQTDANVQPYLQRFLQSLSGTLAVAIETRQLFEQQQALLEAIIKVLAHAVDAKSPYTGGHCERVPELAEMLLQQAATVSSGPLRDYQPDEEERYAFRIAAWLHDCGKITSPEYVVDKATKLETLYNRIHEIRTRFEVLLRDARIEYWEGIAKGGDEPELAQRLAQAERELQEDYALVAKANLGGESMDDETTEALRRIAERRWLRHFDNRTGLSREEQERMAATPAAATPAEERLLQDRADHRVPWGTRRPPVTRDDPRNLWDFDMHLPEYAFDFGELHN